MMYWTNLKGEGCDVVYAWTLPGQVVTVHLTVLLETLQFLLRSTVPSRSLWVLRASLEAL